MNWRTKLSSRKFWAAVVGFVTPILIIFNVPESEIVTVSGLITACGALVAYIFSEGYVDAAQSFKEEDDE